MPCVCLWGASLLLCLGIVVIKLGERLSLILVILLSWITLWECVIPLVLPDSTWQKASSTSTPIILRVHCSYGNRILLSLIHASVFLVLIMELCISTMLMLCFHWCNCVAWFIGRVCSLISMLKALTLYGIIIFSYVWIGLAIPLSTIYCFARYANVLVEWFD